MKRIIVSEAGGTLTRNFVKSLRAAPEKFYIIGVSSNEYELLLSDSDEKYLIPDARHPKFIKAVNKVIKVSKGDFLHSQHDAVIKVIANNINAVNTKTFIPNTDTINSCVDKYESYKKWAEAGLSVPKSIDINNIKDLKNAFKKLGPKIWIRSKEGGGGSGALPTDNFGFAKLWIDFHGGWGKFMAAELLSDRSVTWSSIWNNGELIVAQSRKRLFWLFSNRAISGVTGVTGAAITIKDKKIDCLSLEAIKAVDEKPNGIFSVDITYDKRGKPRISEINIGRFFTTIHFFTEAGLNMPYIYLKTAFGEKIPNLKQKINPLPQGLMWIRGMDTEPILVKEKEVDLFRRKLKKMQL